ncbi:MAG: ABC transporter permease [Acidobacteria bacterium]|nr:ABC transporter permease [Acidobacteriota bacterium]
MGTLWQDIRFAVRSSLKSPSFLIVSILSLAIGSGVNTAVFTAVKSVFLAPLMVDSPKTLVSLAVRDRQVPNLLPVSYPNFQDYQAKQNVFERMTLLTPAYLQVQREGRNKETWAGEIVLGTFFQVLGVKPAWGRVFTEADTNTPGKGAYAVLSHTLWTNRYGGNRGAIGTTITINKQTFEIIGVMPRGFKGTNLVSQPEVWVPLSMAQFLMPRPEALTDRKALYFFSSARLRAGVSMQQAQQALRPISAQLSKDHPVENGDRTLELVPITQATINPQDREMMEQATVVMMGVVGLVLLISCANVAALLLVRARRRSKEFTIRLAVGANPGRIVRQMLTESLMLSLGGAATGLLVARWTRDLFWKFRPGWVSEGALDLTLDTQVLLFTFGISVVTGVLFGLAPATTIWKRDLATELKERSAQSAHERKWFGVRKLIVMSQCALSVIALVSAGLFVESLRRLQSMDPGFDTQHLALSRLDLVPAHLSKEQGLELYRTVMEKMNATPGVRAASLSSIHLLGSGGFLRGYHLEGQDLSARGSLVLMSAVWPRYYEAAGIRILQGRDFQPGDRESAPKVVIVNEAMAKKSFPGQSAVGKRIKFAEGGWREIVGVVADTKFFSMTEETRTCVYIPLAQEYLPQATLVASAEGNPRQLATAVDQAMGQANRAVTYSRVHTVEDQIGRTLVSQRLGAGLLAVFGLLALLLAAVGIYGLTAYAVTQRSGEIGIRMALGATQGDVLKLFIGQTMLLVVPGLLLGAATSAAFSRLASNLIFGLSTLHPPVYLGATALLAAVAVFACYIPARRATKVDPVTALRQE